MKIKSLLIQSCVTAGLLIFACAAFVEAPPRLSRYFSKFRPMRCENISVLGTTFIYGSCPNNTYVRQPGPDYPNMVATTSCTDSAGARVDCQNGQKLFNRDNYHTYLIGDSFIQAEELDYSQSVYGLINNSKDSPYASAYGLGFSSWNTRQYLQAIRAINKEKSNYDIYLFANDITPRYSRSVYGEVHSQPSNASHPIDGFLLDARRYLSSSITLQKLLNVYSQLNVSPVDKNSRTDYWTYHKKASFKECPPSAVQNNIDSFPPMARDYIMYSYAYDCWDDAQKEAYGLAKEDLKQILSHGKSLNSVVRIILLPPGFSFLNENTPGRLVESYYDIPNDVSLSLFGLRRRLAEDFGDYFFDVESRLVKEVDNYKIRCERDCANLYYFGHDGHFTSKGHEFLFRALYSH